MILPDKNLRLQNSLLGVGSALLPMLNVPQSVSELWDKARTQQEHTISFEKFVLALDFLYTVELVEIRDNLVRKRQHAN